MDLRKPGNIFIIFCSSWCCLNQSITWTGCILNYIGVNIGISQTQSSGFSHKAVWFCFLQLLDDALSRNEDLNESSSSRNTSIENWEEVTPYRNNNDVRSEFPIKDTFLIGIQTICNCTREKGSQYHNMIIKNKLTQTIYGSRLFMKSVSTQTLPIPCSCVDSKKNYKLAESGKSYMVSIFLHILSQCLQTWKYFKLWFQEV